MSVFGGIFLTNVGRNLLIKAQTGAQLKYTKISVGDGYLNDSQIVDLTALKNNVMDLAITNLKKLSSGKVLIGTVLSNQSISSGFYFREIAVFAQDPDLGEILYCYGNAGANAEYIPAKSGADIIEKSIALNLITGNVSNISAVIDSSLVYAAPKDVSDAQAAAEKYTDDKIKALIPGEIGAVALTDFNLFKTDYATDTGAANAYKVILNPAPSGYEIGKIYKFKAANANTGASTFKINDLSAIVIKKNVSLELSANDIIAGQINLIVFDGTNMQLIPNKQVRKTSEIENDSLFPSANGIMQSNLNAEMVGNKKVIDLQPAGSYAAALHNHTSAQISDATNANNANTVVKRDASGNFSAGTITANLAGNASSSSSCSGNSATATNADTLDGNHASAFAPSGFGLGNLAQDISGTDLNAKLYTGFFKGNSMTNAPSTGWYYVINIAHDKNAYVYQEVIAYNTNLRFSRVCVNGIWSSWDFVVKGSDLTNVNTGNKVVLRDANGDFSARIITASLNGNANSASACSGNSATSSTCSGNSATASKLATARTINGVSFDGSANIVLTAAANGGNADTLDGLHSSSFAPSGYGLGTVAADISNTDLNVIRPTGFYRGQNLTNAPLSDWFYIININHGSTYVYQEVIAYGANNANYANLRYSRVNINGTWTHWVQVINDSEVSDLNVANKIVQRNVNGGFAAGDIDAHLTGLADFATRFLAPNYTWTGTLTTGVDVHLTHNLGYYPVVAVSGTAGNTKVSYTFDSVNILRLQEWDSGNNGWSGTVYLW